MCVCVLHVCTRFYYLLILFQICLVDFSVIQIIIPGKQVAVNFDPQLYPLKAAIQFAWKNATFLLFFQVQSYHVFMLSRILGMPQTPGSDPPIFSGFSDPILEESRSDLLGIWRDSNAHDLSNCAVLFFMGSRDDFVYWPTFSWLIFVGFHVGKYIPSSPGSYMGIDEHSWAANGWPEIPE